LLSHAFQQKPHTPARHLPVLTDIPAAFPQKVMVPPKMMMAQILLYMGPGHSPPIFQGKTTESRLAWQTPDIYPYQVHRTDMRPHHQVLLQDQEVLKTGLTLLTENQGKVPMVDLRAIFRPAERGWQHGILRDQNPAPSRIPGRDHRPGQV
jgi:hypothetical protein